MPRPVPPELRRLLASGAPLSSPLPAEDGALLVYRGPADDVRFRHFMDTFPDPGPFARVPGTDVWHLTLPLEPRARIEYKLEIVSGRRRVLVADPLNPAFALDPFGGNSVVTGAGYRFPDWAIRHRRVPAGRVVPLPVRSRSFGLRRHRLYIPAGLDASSPAPLLLVHDGGDYLSYASLAVVLDNLIALGRIGPVRAALLDPGERLVEYAADGRHTDHLVDEVIAAVASRHPVDPARVVAMGASMGAVAALAAAHAHPHAFSGLVLQSGSFVSQTGGPFRRGEVFRPVTRFMAELRTAATAPSPRIAMCCGAYDGLAADDRALAAELAGWGAAVDYEELVDGHHWGCWRDHLARGLGFALGSA